MLTKLLLTTLLCTVALATITPLPKRDDNPPSAKADKPDDPLLLPLCGTGEKKIYVYKNDGHQAFPEDIPTKQGMKEFGSSLVGYDRPWSKDNVPVPCKPGTTGLLLFDGHASVLASISKLIDTSGYFTNVTTAGFASGGDRCLSGLTITTPGGTYRQSYIFGKDQPDSALAFPEGLSQHWGFFILYAILSLSAQRESSSLRRAMEIWTGQEAGYYTDPHPDNLPAILLPGTWENGMQDYYQIADSWPVVGSSNDPPAAVPGWIYTYFSVQSYKDDQVLLRNGDDGDQKWVYLKDLKFDTDIMSALTLKFSPENVGWNSRAPFGTVKA